MKIISTKQWCKKCQDLCHLQGDQWHVRMLYVSPGRLMSSLNVFIYRKEAAGFQPALCLLNFVRPSLLNPTKEVSPLIWDSKLCEAFQFCRQTKWEGPKLLPWREKRYDERYSKHRETRWKLGKDKQSRSSESHDWCSCCHRRCGGGVNPFDISAALEPPTFC